MSESRLIDNRFVEIITPQAPTDNILFLAILVCLLVIAIVIAFFMLVKRNKKIIAMRKLKNIKKRNSSAGENYRRLAFELAEALRMAFGVNRLGKLFLTNDAGEEWQQFRLRLSETCYGQTAPSHEDISYLISFAESRLNSLSAGEQGTG